MSDTNPLEKRWAYAVQFVRNLPPPRNKSEEPSTSDKLRMYALFKQANEGAVNTPRPGWYDVVGKAKWDAWKKLEAMPQDEAKEKYIQVLIEKAEAFDDSPEKTEALSNLMANPPGSSKPDNGRAANTKGQTEESEAAPSNDTASDTPSRDVGEDAGPSSSNIAVIPATPPRPTTTTTTLSTTPSSINRTGTSSIRDLNASTSEATTGGTSQYMTPAHTRSGSLASGGDVFADSMDDVSGTPVAAAVAALQTELNQVRHNAERANARLSSFESGRSGNSDRDQSGLSMDAIVSQLSNHTTRLDALDRAVSRLSTRDRTVTLADLSPATLAVLMGVPVIAAWLVGRSSRRK